jgi:hypothetical protein
MLKARRSPYLVQKTSAVTLVTEAPDFLTIEFARSLAPVPTLAGKAVESVTIVIASPVAAMFITIRTAINRRIPERTDHRDSRNIDTHSKIRVRLCRNARTHTRDHKSSAHCNR